MPAIDIKLMNLQASLEHQLEEAKAGAAEARAELAIFNLPKAEQDLAWPEGPPTSWSTLTDRARRFARQVESLELALTGADALAAPK
jgi:hypothetical protein